VGEGGKSQDIKKTTNKKRDKKTGVAAEFILNSVGTGMPERE